MSGNVLIHVAILTTFSALSERQRHEAEHYLREALEGYRRVLGDDHRSVQISKR